MNTVILVGAGATLAECLPSQPAEQQKPPLDATFFRLCVAANIKGRKKVRKYLVREYGFNPFVPDYGLEEVFNLIYSDALSRRANQDSRDALSALVKMYRDAIMRTTNGLSGNSRSGVGYLLRFLLRTNKERVITFITFNHDLLIEKALDETASMKRYSFVPWNLYAAYGLGFTDDTFAAKRGGRKSTYSSGPTAHSMKVLKLHGSLNWVYSVRSADDWKNIFRRPKGDLYCVNDKSIYRNLRLSGPRLQPTEPLIVPPIYEKSSRISGILDPIWHSAQQAIEAAEEIIVFGYSFPDADISAKGLVRRGVHQGKNLRKIHVIDVNPNVAAKVCDILDTPAISHYKTVGDFCRLNQVA
jgi:hypothetical protein